MTSFSAEYIRAVAFDLTSGKATMSNPVQQAIDILKELATAKEALNAKKAAYRAGKK